MKKIIFFIVILVFFKNAHGKCEIEYDFQIASKELNAISNLCNHLVSNSNFPQSTIEVLLTKEINFPNAFALYYKKSQLIVISQSFLRIHNFDPKLLAFVFGHEIGHLQLGHVKSETTFSKLFDSFRSGMSASIGSDSNPLASGLKISLNSYEAKYSQSQEIAADNFSYKLLLRSGFTKLDVLNSLSILNENTSSKSWTRFFSTHPSTQKRIDNISNQ